MNHSDDITAISAALAKAQGSYRPALKNQTNPFYESNYMDLAGAFECCREALAQNDIAVIQSGSRNGDDKEPWRLETMLVHKSGQWIATEVPLVPVKKDPQGLGACITYMRRYGLCAALGIAQEDDDGETAQGRGGKRSTSPEKVADEWGEKAGKQLSAHNAKGRTVEEEGDPFE